VGTLICDVVMSCVLCGTHHKLECRSTGVLIKQVEGKYTCGPFVYKRLKNMVENQCLVCILCLNHIRKRKTHKRKQMLPMDHFLLSLLNPEFQFTMDTRSKKRIVKVLKEKNNVFATSCIAPLSILITSKNFAVDWWNLNLKTFFFVGGRTSRFIRINIKHSNFTT